MRIIGVNIPDNKKLHTALTYIYGVGPKVAQSILETTGIDGNKRAKDLTQDELSKIREVIEKSFTVEGELRQSIRQNINRLKTINSYRGGRHSKNLPARGQQTKHNSRTRRGNTRLTVGSGKRKLTLK